jgi:haloacetate dehalogenase
MFEGFERVRVEAEGASIKAVRGGEGPPLLLHGSTQRHVMWHLVVPRLAEDFMVIASDLRGYGDSSKPEGGEGHAGYSKPAMALDQVEVMRHFGFERFALCSHDRDGRVGYRMTLDNSEVVTRLAILDIVPTWEAFSRANMAFGLSLLALVFLSPTVRPARAPARDRPGEDPLQGRQLRYYPRGDGGVRALPARPRSHPRHL